MSASTEVRLRKHTRREFRQRMESGELKACIIPVAAIEQHLEHLAMEHDWRSVCHVAVAVAERLRPHVVVATVNHEGQALGSTQDGRLRFWETPHGLCFCLTLPATGRETRRIADATRRREIKGASVVWQLTRGSRFRSKTVSGVEWIVEGDIKESRSPLSVAAEESSNAEDQKASVYDSGNAECVIRINTSDPAERGPDEPVWRIPCGRSGYVIGRIPGVPKIL